MLRKQTVSAILWGHGSSEIKW